MLWFRPTTVMHDYVGPHILARRLSLDVLVYSLPVVLQVHIPAWKPLLQNHWRTVCEVKRLQRLLVAAEPPGSRRRCGVEHCADEGQLRIDASLAVERGLRFGSGMVANDGSILVCAGHVLEVTSSHGDAQ